MLTHANGKQGVTKWWSVGEIAASSTHSGKHTQVGSRGAGVGVVLGGNEPHQSGRKTLKKAQWGAVSATAKCAELGPLATQS